MTWQGHEENFRAIAGVIVGIVVWWLLFYVLEINFWLLWAGFGSMMGQASAGARYDPFATAVLLLNISLVLIDGVVVGWLVSKISRNFASVSVVAGFFLLYWLWKTYHQYPGSTPSWYHVSVPWVIAGAIVLGGRLNRRLPKVSV